MNGKAHGNIGMNIELVKVVVHELRTLEGFRCQVNKYTTLNICKESETSAAQKGVVEKTGKLLLDMLAL